MSDPLVNIGFRDCGFRMKHDIDRPISRAKNERVLLRAEKRLYPDLSCSVFCSVDGLIAASGRGPVDRYKSMFGSPPDVGIS